MFERELWREGETEHLRVESEDVVRVSVVVVHGEGERHGWQRGVIVRAQAALSMRRRDKSEEQTI